MPIIGTEPIIRGISAPMLRDYFETYYHPANMVLAAAGAVTHDRFLDLARRHFGAGSRRGRRIPTDFFNMKEEQHKPALLFQEDQDSQVQLQVCFRSLSYNHPDFFVLLLINRMFDDGVCSRLQQALREDRGLVYSVENRTTCWSDTGTFDFDVQVRPEKTAAVLEILFREIKRFLVEGPDQAELEHVRKRYIWDLDLDLDDPYKQIERYGFSQLYSREMSVEEERARVEAVTLADVNRVASKILTPALLNVVLVGPLSPELKQEVERQTDAF